MAALSENADPRQYVMKMRQRESALDADGGTICTPLELKAPEGKLRETHWEAKIAELRAEVAARLKAALGRYGG